MCKEGQTVTAEQGGRNSTGKELKGHQEAGPPSWRTITIISAWGHPSNEITEPQREVYVTAESLSSHLAQGCGRQDSNFPKTNSSSQ